MQLSIRLKDLREQAGLTQTALARPRYSVSYVSQIEAGRRKPSTEAMSFFAGKLGVTPNFLATGVPEDLEESLRYQLEESRRGFREGRLEDAVTTVEPVIAQARQYGLGPLVARSLAVKGEALVREGRLKEGIETFEEALEGELSAHDSALAVSWLARAYRSYGDLTYAAEVVDRFLTKDDQGPLEPWVVAELQAVLLSIYYERGDVLRAERAARRALSAADQGAPPEIRANACWDASRVFAEAKRWDEALDLATRARIIMEELDNRRQVARLHNAYAYICLETDPPRADEAATHLARAESLLLEESAPSVELAYVHTERARVALLQGRPDEAVTLCDQSLAEVGSDDLETARCLFIKGQALTAVGRAEEAAETHRQAVQIFGGHGARQQEALCWREIGELELAKGDTESAVKALRAGLQALGPPRPALLP
jgi:tetratricopeptide (TPR) repeat protein